MRVAVEWVWILPPIALVTGVCLAAGIYCQLLQLLISQPLTHCLLPLLDSLQAALPLLVPDLPTLAG